MQIKRKMIQFSLSRPGLTVSLMAAVTLLAALLLASHPGVDTKPLNILPADNPARLFQQRTWKEFGLHDRVMIGVINTRDKHGVFNPVSLKKIVQLSRFSARILKQLNPDHPDITEEIIAPDTVATVEQAGLGRIRFQPLITALPTNRKQALAIRDRALNDPLLRGRLISRDGKSLALYLPITRRDIVPALHRRLQRKINELSSDNDQFFLTGPPIIEETGGRKLRTGTILAVALVLAATGLLMLIFFTGFGVIIAPIFIALSTVITTMGLFVGTGNTLSPTSLVIPLLLLAVTLTGSIYFLFCCPDKHSRKEELRQTLGTVMERRFFPTLFIALAVAAGIGSLIVTDLPPLRFFGLFGAIGVLLAWLFTTTCLPALLVLMQKRGRQKIQRTEFNTTADRFAAIIQSFFTRLPIWLIQSSTSKPWWVIGLITLTIVPGAGGILTSHYTPGPMSWFPKSGNLPTAERILNQHFDGTGEAYLVLSGSGEKTDIRKAADQLSATLARSLGKTPVIREKALAEISQAVSENSSLQALAKRLRLAWQKEIDRLAPDDDTGYEAWSHALDSLDRLRNQNRIFKHPELLQYMLTLQQYLDSLPQVGGSISVADIVRKVHQELFEGDAGYFTIPATVSGVTQALVSYQTRHTPDDLPKLVSRDFNRANIRLFLKGNDGKDMERLVADTNRFLTKNPPPVKLTLHWAGPAYINMVTEDALTTALHRTLIAGYLVAWLVIILMKRSPWQGISVMLPPIFVLGIVYGPAALIFSAISLPTTMLMFLPLAMAGYCGAQEVRELTANLARIDNEQTVEMEPVKAQARAIAGTAVLMSLSWFPLLFLPMIPLQRVGILAGATAFVSGLACLCIVPALLTTTKKWLLKKQKSADDRTP